jgi:hypothetical protein
VWPGQRDRRPAVFLDDAKEEGDPLREEGDPLRELEAFRRVHVIEASEMG